MGHPPDPLGTQQTDRQTDRQADRQTDRQTDRQLVLFINTCHYRQTIKEKPSNQCVSIINKYFTLFRDSLQRLFEIP